MTNGFNINELAKLAQNLLDRASQGQEYMLEDVHNITRIAYEQYPEDPVITQIAFTIERMASNAPAGATISQANISKIYNEFVRLSGNSKFRETLGFLLLGTQEQQNTQSPDYTRMNRVDADDSELNTDDFVDNTLVDAISAAFDGSLDSVKAFNVKVAEKGKEFVKAELKALGFNNTSVDIMGGNPFNIVYAAHFDTRKGRVTIAIPTEVNNGRVLFPSTFVANDHLEELTSNKLNYFVDAKTEAEDFSVPKAVDVLTAVGVLNGRMRDASEEEFSGAQKVFGEEKESMEFSVPSLFVDKEYEDPRADIDTRQEVEMPEELAHLARDFENDVLEAASTFGMDAITKGKKMIADELKLAGFRNAQVKFGSEGGDSVVYLAVIHTPKGPAEIEVPVEMQSVGSKYLPLAPSYFAYDGLIEDFSATKLQRFAISLPAPSTKNVTYSTAFNYMTLPELKDEIIKAAGVGDYVTCEAALAEVQEKFSEEDFKNAVADYHYILMHKAHMTKQEQRKCAKMIPAGKGSIYARCGHFGVPMHKVVVDDQGNCRMKTAVERENLNKQEDGGAAISNAKVFMS